MCGAAVLLFSYIKFDWCGDIKDEILQGPAAHKAWSKAVNATARPMFIEVVTGYFFLGAAQVHTVANSWRYCLGKISPDYPASSSSKPFQSRVA